VKITSPEEWAQILGRKSMVRIAISICQECADKIMGGSSGQGDLAIRILRDQGCGHALALAGQH
jgi:hypothetical protein